MDKARRYPSVPSHALPKNKFTEATANGLTQAILSWLELNGCWATRVSSAGRYIASQGKFIPSDNRVNVGKDRMSEDQHKVKAAIEKAGGVWFVACSFDEFLTFYKTMTK